ncbi:hypothetical protein ABZ896_46425 [Streptomyces sp. NPDC047072]|uniref:hypothetical protein n=1 Tax=Streptomyces sp. NPDC047072 TaxID=3154809 RepID=UPI0033E5188B
MTNLELYAPAPSPVEGDLAALLGDCARMTPHWAAPERVVSLPVPPSLIHGVTVPEGSARLLDAMAVYGY